MAIYKEVDMREIKFRTWKSWRKPTMLYSGQFDIKWSAENGRYQAIDRTRFDSQWDMPLMQYTGLKDKNGKEIYEGDILKGNQGNFIADFENGRFIVKFPSGATVQNLCTFLDSNGEKEVIGNIYENRELL